MKRHASAMKLARNNPKRALCRPLLAERAGGFVRRQDASAWLVTRSAVARWIVVVLGLTTLGLLWACDPSRWGVEMCRFHAATGLYCPACGITRATHALLHGHLVSALRYNAAWVVLLVPLGTAVMREFLVQRPGQACNIRRQVRRPGWWALGLLVCLALFTLARNLPWYPFVLLTPPG